MLSETRDECNKMTIETRESINLEKKAAEEYLLNFENQKKIIEKTQTFGANIKLNVGGSKFTTTKATLIRFPDTALGAMFSGRFEMNLDEEGYVFIDRDGTHFRHILNFLRDPASFEWNEMSPRELKELRNETNYYLLTDKMFGCLLTVNAVSYQGVVAQYEITKDSSSIWIESKTQYPLLYCRNCKVMEIPWDKVATYNRTSRIADFGDITQIYVNQPSFVDFNQQRLGVNRSNQKKSNQNIFQCGSGQMYA